MTHPALNKYMDSVHYSTVEEYRLAVMYTTHCIIAVYLRVSVLAGATMVPCTNPGIRAAEFTDSFQNLQSHGSLEFPEGTCLIL